MESVKWNYAKLADCLQNGQEERVRELLASFRLSFGEGFSDGDAETELKKCPESGEAVESVRKPQNLPELEDYRKLSGGREDYKAGLAGKNCEASFRLIFPKNAAEG